MAAPLPRSISDDEWKLMGGSADFPNLDRNSPDVRVTGVIDRAYNCFAWTLGRDDRWIFPGPTVEEVDAYCINATPCPFFL